MSTIQSLKVFIQQRLTATVEEVMGHLERTLTEYEEEMKSRHLQLLVSTPQETLQTAAVQQLVVKAEVSSEQQQWSSSWDQGNPECPHIKEEEQDFWSLEDERNEFLFTHVPVKNGNDDKKAPSTQLQQRQTEENREPPASSSTQHIKAEEDCGGSEPGGILESGFISLSGCNDKTSHSATVETEDREDDRTETRKPQTDCNTMEPKVSGNDLGPTKLFSCSKCGRRFGQKHHLKTHMRCHTGEKPFSCSLCGKRFSQKGNMTQHLTVHTREKPCSCPVCGERFAQKGNLTQHMTVHTREKLCW